MSLRDDLLKEQKEAEEAKKEAEKKAVDAAKLEEKQKKEDEAQKKHDLAAKYFQIKQDIANGNPPKDYIELYEKYIARIRECVKKGEKSFHFSDEVSREYYEQKASVTNALGSEIDLLTSFMINKLNEDGFYNINFELKEDYVAYATEMDKRITQNKIEKAEREAKEKYDDDLRKYYAERYSADNYGSSNYSIEPDMYSKKYQPKYVAPVMTGKRKVYTMTLDCSLQGKKRKQIPISKKTYSLINNLISSVAGLAGGIFSGWFIINWFNVHQWEYGWAIGIIAGIFICYGVYSLIGYIIDLISGNKNTFNKSTKK